MSDPALPVALTTPAKPSSLQVLRAVAGSVATRLDLPYDVVEEIRLAVDEAATLLLGLGGSELSLEVDPHGPGFAAMLWIDAEVEEWPAPSVESSWPWRVIGGLCDEALFARPDGHPGIGLRRGVAGAR